MRIEELIPTTRPDMSTSGPPELPGLIAASVWIAGYVVLRSWPPDCGWPPPKGLSGACGSSSALDTETGRFRALTMPVVTVAFRPNGEPTATTAWPTLSSPDLPRDAGVRSETSSALITATSVSGSVPTTLAFFVVPSLKLTEIDPSPAPATTWLLVRISPSLLSTMPEPEPDPCSLETLTLTTDGSTAFATFSTVPSLTAAVFVASKDPEVSVVELFEPFSVNAW